MCHLCLPITTVIQYFMLHKGYIDGRHHMSLELFKQCFFDVENMRGSRNFRQGGPGQSDKKISDNIFFFFNFFKSSAYFTEVKWSISKKYIIF